MLQTVQKVVYKGFGFQILSDILLPELPKISSRESQVDIVFEKADLSEIWAKLAEPNRYFVINENLILFHIPNLAIYSIQDGNRVIVSSMEGSNEDQVRLYLLGTCMGALLMQRKVLPLHGSAIEINGKAYAIIGDSGAGKSTLASAFLNRGHQLISDDIIPVSFTEANIPIVTPAYPQQKLWQESLQAFGLESDHLRPIVDRVTKFAVPVHSQFVSKQLPLSGVFELVKTENKRIEIQPIKSLERLNTLFHHTYRNFLLAPSGLLEWHFSFTANLVSKIKFNQIQRPISQFTANDLTTLILSKLNEGE
ncbi:aldolase [Neobacillus sp. FSL H8-0543]|uniref:aldolase n=1 Tax=Neobacillus sp. FSL H8-0543 TaxID=2954672 RepID=UPI003158DF6D